MVATGVGQQLGEAQQQGHAVGQAGQCIGLRDVAHAVLGLLALGDVGQDPHVVGRHAALRVIDPVDPGAGREVVAVLLGDGQFAVPGAAQCQLIGHLLGRLALFKLDQGEDGLPGQFARVVAGHLGGGRVDRQNAVCLVGEDDAGRRMAVDLLGQLLALGAVATFSHVGVDRHETTIGEWHATDFERLAVRPGAFEIVARRRGDALHQCAGDLLRVARSVLAAFGIEAEHAFDRGAGLYQFVREVEQTPEFAIAQLKRPVPVEQADGAGNALQDGLQLVVLLAQPRFDCLALGDVGIGGDEADDMVANMQRLALDQVRGPVRSGALEAVRLELAGQAGDALDMRFDVARAIFAAGGGDADQVRERHAFIDGRVRQAKNVDEALVPDAQTQAFVKHADTLRHARDDRLQISQLALNIAGRWRRGIR